MFFPHGPERPYTAHIAGSAGLDALPDPRLFQLQALVEQGVLALFIFQRLFFQLQVLVIVGRKTDQLPPVQLDYAGRHAPDKGPVMADKQHGTPKLAQSLFQPGNRGHIKMVGWLIQ